MAHSVLLYCQAEEAYRPGCRTGLEVWDRCRCPVRSPDSQPCPYGGLTSGCSEALPSLFRIVLPWLCYCRHHSSTTGPCMAPSRLVQGLLETRDCRTHRDARPPGQLEHPDSWTPGLSHTWGCRAPQDSQILGLLGSWSCWIPGSPGYWTPRTATTGSCHTPGAARSPGQTDPGAVGHLRLPGP